jgi:hypothetical protein
LGAFLLVASIVIETFRPQSCSDDPTTLSAAVHNIHNTTKMTTMKQRRQSILFYLSLMDYVLDLDFDVVEYFGHTNSVVLLLGRVFHIIGTNPRNKASFNRNKETLQTSAQIPFLQKTVRINFSVNYVLIQNEVCSMSVDQFGNPQPLFSTSMRPLTEEETKIFFEKLAK